MEFGDSSAGEHPAVVFDVDGVLLNSLPAHLAICRDKSQEFGLDLEIPTESALKDMVRNGVVISPMKEFFRAVGFPEAHARRAAEDYARDFSRRYESLPFAGVAPVLARLADAGVALGLVSSNTLLNVSSGLGALMRYFGDFAFTCDHPRDQPKAAALLELLGTMRVAPRQAVYVGDQPADARAAQQVGMQFLGVTYGWGLHGGDLALHTVDTPAELASELLKLLAVKKASRTGT